jgi:hypothetical protein
LRIRFFAASVLTLVFALTIASCGGSPSSNLKTPTPTASASPSPGPTSGPAPAPTPTPAPPAGTTVLDNVEDTRTWLTCGNCANTNATGATAKASFTPGIASPSEDGTSTQFSIVPTAPYSNAYWWLEHAPVASQINALTYEFDLYIPQGMETLSQAIEFECQQIIGGWVYNFGWQAEYGANIWRIFDYGLKRWDATSVPFTPFTPGTWHHIVSEFHNNLTTHTVYHDALTVDGVRYPLGIAHNAFHSGSFDKFTNAVQLDSTSKVQPYSICVDRMRITYR